MNKAERVSKLIVKFTVLGKALRKEGLDDVADKMSDASMLLVKHGLEEYSREYQQVK